MSDESVDNIRVLVTGANGFIGRHLCSELEIRSGFVVAGAVRRLSAPRADYVFSVGSIDGKTDWTSALRGTDVVVHAAGYNRVPQSDDPWSRLQTVNVEGTLNLARQAEKAGVRRFVFLSSLKVHGEESPRDQPFTSSSPYAPEGAYAKSKFEAELGLWSMIKDTEMDLVVIRPPMVFGPDGGRGVLGLLKLIRAGIPLPLARVDNKRSIIGIDNLVDFIIRCTVHPGARNRAFLVSDGEDLSSRQLLEMLGKAVGRSVFLWPLPPEWIRRCASLVRMPGVARSLLGSLQADIGQCAECLGWVPELPTQLAMSRYFGTADWRDA